jgi:predicted transcriptional regulator
MPRPISAKTAAQARVIYAAIVEHASDGVTVLDLAHLCDLRPCDVRHALTVMDDLGLLCFEEQDPQLAFDGFRLEDDEDDARTRLFPCEEEVVRAHPAYQNIEQN